MHKKELYCTYCDAEFIIEALNLAHINHCPNCATELEVDLEEDEYDEWDD